MNPVGQRGQAMTEYIIITTLVGIAAIGAFQLFGEAARQQAAVSASALAGKDISVQSISSVTSNAVTLATNSSSMGGGGGIGGTGYGDGASSDKGGIGGTGHGGGGNGLPETREKPPKEESMPEEYQPDNPVPEQGPSSSPTSTNSGTKSSVR